MHSSQTKGLRRMLSNKTDHTCRNSHYRPHRLRSGFPNTAGEEIVEEQEKMCAHADRASAVAVDRNDGLGGNLPRTRHIRQSRIHRGSGFFSTRRIERKFDDLDELMHWF